MIMCKEENGSNSHEQHNNYWRATIINTSTPLFGYSSSSSDAPMELEPLLRQLLVGILVYVCVNVFGCIHLINPLRNTRIVQCEVGNSYLEKNWHSKTFSFCFTTNSTG